jgi:2'-5' RNA ligase
MDLLAPQPSLFPPGPQPAAPSADPTRPGPDRHPVFFAILPPPSLEPELRRALDAARRWGVTAKLGAPATRHLSLVALGFAQHLGAEHRAVAEAAAGSLDIRAFTLRFDRIASFRAKPGNKRPLVLLPADPAPLDALTTALRTAMIDRGLVPQRPPQRFHLSLCYDRTDVRTRPIDPVDLKVDRLTLVRSVYGETRYEHWGEWQFG